MQCEGLPGRSRRHGGEVWIAELCAACLRSGEGCGRSSADSFALGLSHDRHDSHNGLIHLGRFIPYVMMHEFEGMLFSDCKLFADGIGKPQMATQLMAIRSQFDTPEHINDSPETAPSKRIEALIPSYQKPLFGNLAALEIVLEPIRQACPHFRQWLDRLEAWPKKES